MAVRPDRPITRTRRKNTNPKPREHEPLLPGACFIVRGLVIPKRPPQSTPGRSRLPLPLFIIPARLTLDALYGGSIAKVTMPSYCDEYVIRQIEFDVSS